jgi:IS6 family transposase
MRGLKRLATAAVVTAGHAFVQNLRRGHYQLGTESASELRLTDAFAELALAM